VGCAFRLCLPHRHTVCRQPFDISSNAIRSLRQPFDNPSTFIRPPFDVSLTAIQQTLRRLFDCYSTTSRPLLGKHDSRGAANQPGKCRAHAQGRTQLTLRHTQLTLRQTTWGVCIILCLAPPQSLGINDLIHFDFMDPPPAETLIRALEQVGLVWEYRVWCPYV
jgi:hypothetical protein